MWMRWGHGLVVTVLAAVVAHGGAVPRTLSFQGNLRDHSGNAIDDPALSIVFRIYDDEESTAPAHLLWEDSVVVSVTDGRFSALLGDTTSGSAALDLPFDSQYWIALVVSPDSEEMTPRFKLAAAPYAMRAAYAEAVPPVALLSASLDSISFTGMVYSLDASDSYDPSGTGLLYAWDPDGPGDFGTYGSTSQIQHTFPGWTLPAVRVKNAAGLVAENKIRVGTQGYFDTYDYWRARQSLVHQGKPADGEHPFLAELNGLPVVAYTNTDGALCFASNPEEDGSSPWATQVVVQAAQFGGIHDFAVVSGVPLILYADEAEGLKAAVCPDYVGAPTVWGTYGVDPTTPVAKDWASLASVSGAPCVAYYKDTTTELWFARCGDVAAAPDTWQTGAVAAVELGCPPSISSILGKPAVAYMQSSDKAVSYAANASADGSSAWSVQPMLTVSSGGLHLAEVEGKPACVVFAFIDGRGTPAFSICLDPVGDPTVWTTRAIPGVGKASSFAVLRRLPFTVSHFSISLSYCNVPDGQGVWERRSLSNFLSANMGRRAIADIGGKGAVTWYDGEGIHYAREP